MVRQAHHDIAKGGKDKRRARRRIKKNLSSPSPIKNFEDRLRRESSFYKRRGFRIKSGMTGGEEETPNICERR